MSNTIRFWSPEWVDRQITQLVEDYGVSTLRIVDELFYLKPSHYKPILEKIIEKKQHIRSWAYTRIDTLRPQFLDLFINAGIRWFAIGIESANQQIRREITKGKFEEVNIRKVVDEVQSHGGWIGANYIFGFPNENEAKMQETLDLSIELNTEFANFYTAMALPGSPLYYTAIQNDWELPQTPEAWSFHSYECQPLPTNYMTAAEVLAFRDKAWHAYFERPEFLSLIRSTFGDEAADNIVLQSKTKLKRRLLHV